MYVTTVSCAILFHPLQKMQINRMAQDKTTEEQHCDTIIYVYVEQSVRFDKQTSNVSTLCRLTHY